MDQLIAKLNDLADFIIIDSPPMIVADALFLAAKVDGVLVVIRPGYVRKKVLLGMMEQFERAGVRVLGVVFNRIPPTSVDAYGGYGYYSNYYSTYYMDEESSDKKAPSNPQEYFNFYLKKAQAGIENLRHRKADQ